MISWAVLTLGCFSRNRYWGEDDDKSYRSAVCTSTLIRAGGCNILVDPALPGECMYSALDGASGLKPQQIDIVYITHSHGDHYAGLLGFWGAQWLCAPGEIGAVKAAFANNPEAAGKIGAAPDEIAPGVKLIALPGHTPGLAGLVFESRDGVTAVAGDAVMTRDFFDGRQGYYNSADFISSARSIEMLANTADIIIPGHGNYFLTA
ncbi:MAG: MBL fold metallo-hydrolase [Oscillospiraceae bacterium]|nr:MBL fold metallo-hydrolase [Oscillospiraceae bacterium]